MFTKRIKSNIMKEKNVIPSVSIGIFLELTATQWN